jgi:hypothetical protein
MALAGLYVPTSREKAGAALEESQTVFAQSKPQQVPRPVTLLPCHPLTLSPSHPLTPLPYHTLTLSPYHPLTLSPSFPPTLPTSGHLNGLEESQTAASFATSKASQVAIDLRTENSSSEGQFLALTGLCVPSSLLKLPVSTLRVEHPRVARFRVHGIGHRV